MFKAVITEKYTNIQGTKIDMLVGLMCYIDALEKNGIPLKVIKDAIDIKLKDTKKVETILDEENIKIKKIDLTNMSKEEIDEFIENEIKEAFRRFN